MDYPSELRAREKAPFLHFAKKISSFVINIPLETTAGNFPLFKQRQLRPRKHETRQVAQVSDSHYSLSSFTFLEEVSSYCPSKTCAFESSRRNTRDAGQEGAHGRALKDIRCCCWERKKRRLSSCIGGPGRDGWTCGPSAITDSRLLWWSTHWGWRDFFQIRCPHLMAYRKRAYLVVHCLVIIVFPSGDSSTMPIKESGLLTKICFKNKIFFASVRSKKEREPIFKYPRRSGQYFVDAPSAANEWSATVDLFVFQSFLCGCWMLRVVSLLECTFSLPPSKSQCLDALPHQSASSCPVTWYGMCTASGRFKQAAASFRFQRVSNLVFQPSPEFSDLMLGFPASWGRQVLLGTGEVPLSSLDANAKLYDSCIKINNTSKGVNTLYGHYTSKCWWNHCFSIYFLYLSPWPVFFFFFDCLFKNKQTKKNNTTQPLSWIL